MALLDQYNLANDATFKQKVEQAILEAAVAVIGQSNPPSDRLALAQRVIYDSVAFTSMFVKALVTDNTIAAAAPTGAGLTDADIQTAVNTMLPRFVR